MPDTYRALVALPRARRLLTALIAAWLSFGGVSLVVLLTVRASTGSYAAGGAGAAAFALGSAALAPARGRLVDRRGGGVLRLLAGGYAAALVALGVLSRLGAPTSLLLLAAATAGLSAPPLVASTRGAWSTLLRPGLVRRAYAATSVVGDVATVGAPAVCGALCAWSPPAATALCAGTALGGAFLAAPLVRTSPRDSRAGSGLGGFGIVVAVSIALGASLGLVEVAVPAAATRWHATAFAGVLLGAFALGSTAGGLWYGRRSWRGPAHRRFLAALLVVAIALLPPLAATGPVALALLLAVAGLGYGPATVALFEVLDTQTGVGATEALTWITMAEGGGAALGATGAGVLVGHASPTTAFGVAAVVLAAPALAALAYGARSPSQ